MTLHQLKIFTVVAKHLNVTAAAAELYIVPASVSKQLAALEKELNSQFHVRIGHKIELTKEGQLFLRDAQALLERADRLKERFDAKSLAAKRSSLTVGGTFNPSATFLPSALALFKKSHPGVTLTLRTGTKYAVEQMVLRGEVDIAAVYNPPQSSELMKEPFRRERLMAFVSRNHPLATKGSFDLADLPQTPLVIRADAGRGLSATEEILKGLEDNGVKVNIAMRCQSPNSVRAAVANNMGVGLLFEGLIKDGLRSGVFRALTIRGLDLVRKSYIVYGKQKPLSENARDFLELLLQQRRKGGRGIADKD